MKSKMILLLLLFVASGCASAPVYQQIQKDQSQDNTRIFAASASQLHRALIEMLLQKHFSIDKEDMGTGDVLASRYFTKGHDNYVIILKSQILPKDEGHQQLYLTGIQTTQRNYVADRTRFLLWVLPLPGGGGKEVTKTKEFQETIQDASFYADLFKAIEKNLGE